MLSQLKLQNNMDTDIKRRIEAAYTLLQQETTTREKFESVRTLIKGINPQLDKQLTNVSRALSDMENLQKGQVIELSAEHLPEPTEEDKRRKRALLLFIRTWKQLASEVERVRAEVEKMGEQESVKEKATSVSKLVGLAKGPFGIITVIALLIAGGFILINGQRSSVPTQRVTSLPSPPKTKVIIFNDKKIPVSGLRVGEGPECEGPHYHANDGTATRSLDGSLVPDPGGCGYGKVSEVEVVEETILQ